MQRFGKSPNFQKLNINKLGSKKDVKMGQYFTLSENENSISKIGGVIKAIFRGKFIALNTNVGKEKKFSINDH